MNRFRWALLVLWLCCAMFNYGAMYAHFNWRNQNEWLSLHLSMRDEAGLLGGITMAGPIGLGPSLFITNFCQHGWYVTYRDVRKKAAADLHFTTLGDSTGTGPSEDYVLSEFGVSSIELRVSVEMDAQRVWRDKLRIWEKPSPCYPGWHDISSREEIVLVCWSQWNEIMHEATPAQP